MRNPYSVDVKMDISNNTSHLFAESMKHNAVIMSLDAAKIGTDPMQEKKID